MDVENIVVLLKIIQSELEAINYHRLAKKVITLKRDIIDELVNP